MGQIYNPFFNLPNLERCHLAQFPKELSSSSMQGGGGKRFLFYVETCSPPMVDPLSVHSLVRSQGIHVRAAICAMCTCSSCLFPFAQESPSQFHLTSKLFSNQDAPFHALSLAWSKDCTFWELRIQGGGRGCTHLHPWNQKSIFEPMISLHGVMARAKRKTSSLHVPF